MNKILYHHSFLAAFTIALSIGFVWFTFLVATTHNIYNQGFFGAVFIGIISPLLTFVFLLRLPTGKWWQRIFYEFTMALASLVLMALLYLYIYSLIIYTVQDTLVAEAFYICLIVGVFSHVSVRIFARPFVFWNSIRNKRLVWEITNAQLQFVLLGVIVVFFTVIVIAFVPAFQFIGMDSYTWFFNITSLVIIYAGFLGILAGIALFILILPAIVISYFTARRITQRLEKLILASQAIRRGFYETRIEVAGEDEVTQLQRDFNSMAAELETALFQLKNERDAVANVLESRRRLFADISHELRTPLATIRLYLEKLKKDTTSENLHIIENDVLRLQRLIDDVFILAQADSRQLTYHIEAQNITTVLESIVQSSKPQAWQAKRVDVLLEYEPTLPLIMVDKERLEQVLLNLLRNAIRHTAPGGLVVVSAKALSETIEIEVRDTGEGIAPEDLPHIWERFYRAEESRIAEPQGLGLGLPLVKEMLEAMGGSISVETIPKEGTCFRFRLPRCDNSATVLR